MAPCPVSTSVHHWSTMLREQGYCIIPELLPEATIHALDIDLAADFDRTPFGKGGFYGETTKRFGRLLTRSPRTAALVQHPLVVAIVEQLLLPWCDCIQLNVAQAIAVHPGAPAQMPHRDQDMWRPPVGEREYLVNVIWPLSDFSAENGATMVWPESHGAAAASIEPSCAPIAATMPPGAALLFLGSTLHGAGANRTDEVRRGVVIGYSLGWLKTYENQYLAYPPAIAARFAPELAALIGYRQHRPNLGNFEGQSPAVLLGGDRDAPRAAVDALRPDQAALVETFMARQGRAS